MARVHEQTRLRNGNYLVLAQTAGRGGGWSHPATIRIVEINTQEFRRSSARNVVSIRYEHEGLDSRHTGPRSQFHAALSDARDEFNQIVARNDNAARRASA